MKSIKKRINLDWNKLTGFNQVSSAQSGAGKKVGKGAKVGVKPPPASPL